MARFQKALAQLMQHEATTESPDRTQTSPPRGIISELRQRVSTEERDLVASFADAFLPSAQLLEPTLSPSDTASLALGAYRFLCDRLSQAYALRVYTPTVSEHGWESENRIVEIAIDDQASLVDTVCEAIEQLGAEIELIASAQVQVERSETGMATAIRPGDRQTDECVLHVQVKGLGDERELEAALRRRMDALSKGRRDIESIGGQLLELKNRLAGGNAEDIETAALLDWLDADHMTFVGYQEASRAAGSDAPALGIYANPPANIEPSWDPDETDTPLAVVKTAAVDPIRQRCFLDELRIRPGAAESNAPAAYRLAGTFSTRAFLTPSTTIPVARKLFASLEEHLPTDNDVVDTESARAIFDGLPIDFLLGTPLSEVGKLIGSIHAANGDPAFRLHSFPALAGARTFMTIVVPRQHLSRNDTARVSDIVGETIAPVLAVHFVSDDLGIARLHCTLDTTNEKLRPEILEDATARIRKMLSSWRDVPVLDRTATDPTPAQPEQAASPPVSASSAASDELTVGSLRIDGGTASSGKFSIQAKTERTPGILNQLVSMIDDFGLRVIDHRATEEQSRQLLHEIDVELPDGANLAKLTETIQSVYAGQAESDPLNALSWRAGLETESLMLVRALAALAAQHGSIGRDAIHEALAANPDHTSALLQCFVAKFDPRLPVSSEGQRKRDLAAQRASFDAAIKLLETTPTREVFTSLGQLLDAVQRTSFYRSDTGTRPAAIALKLEFDEESSKPLETFVYAPGFEGALLRAGRVARASVRMLSQVGQLRTALGLELDSECIRSTHVITEAAIAGVALRSSTSNPDLVDEAFHHFLCGILDVMDNIESGEVRGEPSVIAYDGEDPYISFMIGERPTGLAELATMTVADRRFWLGDACITRYDSRVAADGAWASIRTVLPEDRGTNSTTLTAVALGSPHDLHLVPVVRLLAAFDDHDIFVDPQAESKQSHEALQKLARQRGCSWSDFPMDLRGRGSAVFARDANKIELSAEAAELLGIDRTVASGEELVQAILKLPADILWCRQASLHVGTAPTRPELRHYNVADVGPRVVAEVGVSVFEAKARVQFALRDGAIHTSASHQLAADLLADRVSSVDLALSLAAQEGAPPQVHTTEVAAEIRRAVVELPAHHIFSTTLDEIRSSTNWIPFATCIRALSDGGEHDPTGHLVSELDLTRRQGSRRGLTAPEIIALRGAVARSLRHQILSSSLGEDPYLAAWVDTYFPAEMPERFTAAIDRHPLRNEIAALAVTDRLIDVMGAAFVADVAETHAVRPIEVVKSWCATFIFGGAQEVWAELDDAAKQLSEDSHQQHRLELGTCLELATRRVIELSSRSFSLEKLIDRFGSATAELLRSWEDNLPEAMKDNYRAAIELRTRTGLSETVADHLERISHLPEIVDICDLAIQINCARSSISTVFLGLDPILGLRELTRLIHKIGQHDRLWGTRAAAYMGARLATARRTLTSEIVLNNRGKRHQLESFLETRQSEIRDLELLRGEIGTRGDISIAGVEVLLSTLEQLVQSQQRSWQK